MKGPVEILAVDHIESTPTENGRRRWIRDPAGLHATNWWMPTFRVETRHGCYDALVERGALAQLARCIPVKAGKVFVVSEENVMALHGDSVGEALASVPYETLLLPGG